MGAKYSTGASSLGSQLMEVGFSFRRLRWPKTPAPTAAPSNEGNSFQFHDAPIELVLSQVLGEAFGFSYVLEPSLQARLTLRLDGVSDGDAAAAALGAALQMQGISLSKTPSGYMVSGSSLGATANSRSCRHRRTLHRPMPPSSSFITPTQTMLCDWRNQFCHLTLLS